MKVFLQLEPGKKLILDLEIEASATVTDLKASINALNQTKDPANLHCIFKSNLKKYPDILEDSKTLADYNIAEGSVIQYLYQQASTGESTSSETKE